MIFHCSGRIEPLLLEMRTIKLFTNATKLNFYFTSFKALIPLNGILIVALLSLFQRQYNADSKMLLCAIVAQKNQAKCVVSEKQLNTK